MKDARASRSENQFGQGEVPSSALRLADVPSATSRWRDIERFALTFDAYAHWGSLERCAAIAARPTLRTMNELRTKLFFEQRRWRHLGEQPTRDAMREIRAVICDIRQRLKARESFRRKK